MMIQRLTGDVTMKELADAEGISERTARRRLELARKDETFLATARETFVLDLLPRAMGVLRKALDGEDQRLAVQVAIKIVDGLRIMSIDPDKIDSTLPTEEMSLERWREGVTVTHRRPVPTADSPSDAEAGADQPPVIEVSADPPGPADAPPAEDSPDTRI